MKEAPTGSNAWVISGNYTKSGKPALANDPHLDNNIPSYWMQTQLIYNDEAGEEQFVSGVTMSGVPLVMIGRTKHWAWGYTTNIIDTSDLYRLKLVEGVQDCYLYENEKRYFKKFIEHIPVRGEKEPLQLEVYESHHGVVLDQMLPMIYMRRSFGQLKKDTKYALAWTGFTNADTSINYFFNSIKAKNTEQIVEAFRDAIIPS